MATIAENLTQLENTKAGLKDAISSYYDMIDASTPFSAYSGVVDSLGENFVNTMNGGGASITIPEGVTKIKRSLFDSDLVLQSCQLPSTLQTIENYAFQNSGIREINFPDGLETIGNYAFKGCDQFSGTSGTTVIFPDSVTTIGSYMFDGNNNIRSIIIGSGCTSIGSYAFNIGNASSTKLQTLYCYATTPPSVGSGFLNSTVKPNYIYVPSASVNDYKNASGWSTYSTIIKAIPTE